VADDDVVGGFAWLAVVAPSVEADGIERPQRLHAGEQRRAAVDIELPRARQLKVSDVVRRQGVEVVGLEADFDRGRVVNGEWVDQPLPRTLGDGDVAGGDDLAVLEKL